MARRRTAPAGRTLAAAAATALCVTLPGAGPLAGAAAAQSGGDWSFQITPYVWATGLGGDLTIGPRRIRIDRSFSDVLRDLDAAAFVTGFARRDRLVLLGDLSWSSSSRAGLLPPPLPGPLPAEGRLRQTSLTLAAGYRVADTPGATVDLLAGLRHWRVEASARVPALGFAASRSTNFTDPILAARIRADIAPGWSTLVYADVGGFGVGSDLTLQVVATVTYQLSEQISVSGGYRHLHVDYHRGGARVDMDMSGPLLGVTWRF